MTLRRHNEKDDAKELESLLVFGYQCKLFRENEKAMFIDQGKHLIPWMGDETVMIDRYDGRGHLFDLRPYDSELLSTSNDYDLSDKEKAVEKACDEERYLELNVDILSKQMYEEEEMKRLYAAVGEDGSYAAVAFNYDDQSAENAQETLQEIEKPKEEEDEPYEVIPELQVPKGANLPPTIKMHAIIEKTAAFIASQGTQMEIVIAAKQKNNPQFGFLNFGHTLNVYYKHIVKQIQRGKYKPRPQESYIRKKPEPQTQESHEDGHDCLHPSLGGPRAELEEEHLPGKFLESVTAKVPTGQIANTAYAKLLSNLSKHTGRNSPQPKSPKPTAAVEQAAPAAVEEAPVLQPPPLPPFLQAPSEPIAQVMTDPVTVPGPNQPPPPGTEPVLPPASHAAAPYATSYPHPQHPQLHPHTLHHDPYYAHSLDPRYASYYAHYTASYGIEAAGSVTGTQDSVAGAGSLSTGLTSATVSSTHSSAAHGPLLEPRETSTKKVEATVEGPQTQQQKTVEKTAEDSDSDDDLNECPDHVTVPPREVRPIIDKMAAYVFRNGSDFELMMRKKNDERFRFLNTWHPHHSYYEWRLQRLKNPTPQQPQTKAEEGMAAGEPANGTVAGSSVGAEPGLSKSVSFSIKPKDTDPSSGPSMGRRALLGDDEDSDGSGRESVSEKSREDSRDAPPSFTVAPLSTTLPQQPQTAPPQQQSSGAATPDEKKIAAETLRNRLAQAAREKLATVTEEGKLKAERKKKAAMFAKLLAHNPGTADSESMSRISSMPSIAAEGSGLDSLRLALGMSLISSMPSLATEASGLESPRPLPSNPSSRASTPAGPATAPRQDSPAVGKRSASSRARSSSTSSSSGSSSNREESPRKRRRSRSRSKSRKSKRSSKSRRKRSHSRSRRSRSKRSRSNGSKSRHRKKSPPSAYTVVRRSSSPPPPARRKRSHSRSPDRDKHKNRPTSRNASPPPPRSSKRRSYSRSPSRSSKSKKSKKSKKSRAKSPISPTRMVPIPSRAKSPSSPPRMVPIPEVEATPTGGGADSHIVVSSESSDGEADPPDSQNGAKRSGSNSRSSTVSEGEVRSPKPSKDLLSKVRAMLQAQQEILQGDG